MSKKAIYFDYAAATPLSETVMTAMQPYLTERFYNPSATYNSGRAVRTDLDDARVKVAHWLGARSSDIIFTAGGTEANNMAIHGVMANHPSANIVVSSIEHDSILLPAQQYDVRIANVDKTGRIDLADLEAKIDENTLLVSVMYVNNEIGTIQPISQISKIIDKQRRARTTNFPIYLHTDACQATNYLDLHTARLGVDLMTINGGKIYGPKQSGALYVKAGTDIKAIIQGGGQERGLRSGTENVAACIGFATAIDEAQNMRRTEAERLQGLQHSFIKRIAAEFPEAVINGTQKYRIPNNLHATFPGQDNERLLIQLDELGIMAAAGSACSASQDQPSHVLKAIGVTDKDAQSSIRISMGRSTDEDSIDELIKFLRQIIIS